MHFHRILPVVAFSVISSCATPDEAPRATAYTYEELYEPTFDLVELHRLGDSEEPFMQSSSHLQFSSDGLIIVRDFRSNHFVVYDEEGVLRGQFGGPGRGLGQYRSGSRFSVVENDSIVDYDDRNQRVTISRRVGDTWEAARSFPLKATQPDMYMIQEVMRLPGSAAYLSYEVMPHSGNDPERNVLGPRFRTFSDETTAEPSYSPMLELRLSGDYYEFTKVTDEFYSSMFHQIPFARKSLWRVDQRGFVHAALWTENLHIVTYNAAGDSVGGIRIDLPQRPVTDASLAIFSNRGEPVVASRIPTTQPAMADFQVDDRGNYWVDLGATGTEHDVWAVFSPQGRHLGTTHISRVYQNILAIRRDRLYMASGGADGNEPSVIVFDLSGFDQGI